MTTDAKEIAMRWAPPNLAGMLAEQIISYAQHHIQIALKKERGTMLEPSIRDGMAMFAMVGFLNGRILTNKEEFKQAARYAYAMADAMLEARKQ